MPIQHLLILLCGVKTNIMFANLSVISSVLKCVSLQVLYVINVIKAYVFELSWMYIIGLLSYFLNKSIFKLLNFNIVYSQNFTSPPFDGFKRTRIIIKWKGNFVAESATKYLEEEINILPKRVSLQSKQFCENCLSKKVWTS